MSILAGVMGLAAAVSLSSCTLVNQASSSQDQPSRVQPSGGVGENAPVSMACPAELPAGTRCLSGQDSAGAMYVIAVPAQWNGVLVMHAHGGPELGAPRLERSLVDLKRWAITVKAGYAWAGSSYRQGGVVVRAAAEDVERLRKIFIAHVAQPRRTILHGQSWGASVAAKAGEMYAANAKGSPYDALLLTSGVLAGGTRAYDFRLDLRVVYEYLCGNHPASGEPGYPLWMGLPPDSTLTRAQLRGRVNECLGLDKPAAQRSAEQQRKTRAIVQVIRIPESSIVAHLNWATWHFQDIVQYRTGKRNPFGNIGARYVGSDDDAALNRGVARYRADPRAVAVFGADTDLTGAIGVPVLTTHGIDDPTAFVEMDSSFLDTMRKAGTADHLVQTFTLDNTHSYLSDPVYPTLFEALMRWIEEGRKPTPQGIAAACPSMQAKFPGRCGFQPAYHPGALDTRVAARERP